jgi:mannosyl-3-phosphoglycerate phosphatase
MQRAGLPARFFFGTLAGFQPLSVKMDALVAENGLRQTSSVLYIAIDSFVPPGGNVVAGYAEFSASLDRAGIPAVWLTSRTRLQLDEPRRKLGHSHPFIAEDGCGVFLPEDYFHLRPQPALPGPRKKATVRLGRFTCLPVAKAQPAASEALESLSEESGVSVVALRSLPPRELAQNLGLPPREAEMARQRDFDELFFFAGASPGEVENFQTLGHARNVQLRRRGALWSLAIGASVRRCIGELSKLYDRALHSHARTIAIAASRHETELLAACDRAIVLTDKVAATDQPPVPPAPKAWELSFHAPDLWDQILASLSVRP